MQTTFKDEITLCNHFEAVAKTIPVLATLGDGVLRDELHPVFVNISVLGYISALALHLFVT